MKKLIVFLVLAVAAVNARAAIFINNNTGYTITFTLWAHDVVNPAPCSYYCARFHVPGGSSIAYNNVGSRLWAGSNPGKYRLPWWSPGPLSTRSMLCPGLKHCLMQP